MPDIWNCLGKDEIFHLASVSVLVEAYKKDVEKE